MPFLSLLTGPLGKWIAYAGIALAIVAAAAFALHEHDARIRAADAARVAAATQAAQLREAQAATVAVQTVADEASARLAAVTSLKQRIAAAPAPVACAVAPATIRAALAGLKP